MKLGDYKKAMRPKKYLTSSFVVYDGSIDDRSNFYKGGFVKSNPPGEQWVVKFASKSNAPTYPDKFIGTQKFATEELMNQAIADRKNFTAQNIKTKTNPEKQLGEKTLKSLVDDTFTKRDFENFKIKLDPNKIAAAERKGKTRTDTGGKIPSQYLTKFNKAIEAGPDSELFKDLMRITGRTEEELLELDAKRPKGKVDPKIRSERAREYGGVDRRLTDEELKEKSKFYKKVRSENQAVGTKYASSEDMARFNTVTQQKESLNKFFINNPNAINNTDFGKKIKILMETRLDKDGNIIRRKVDSKGNPLNDEYYRNLAAQGKIFDTFDINKIAKAQRSTKFATNLNITPSQFNTGFIEGQVDRFFGINPKTGKEGKFFGDTEKLKKVSDFLKSVGVRYDIPGVGRVGADMGVAYDSKTGQFPHIYKTLKKMNIPDSLLLKINPKPNIPGVTTADKVEQPEKSKTRSMFDSFNERIKNAGNTYRSVRPSIDTLTKIIPGKADNALAAAIDFPMMYMSGAPLTQAAASAGSMFINNPNIGKAVNIGLEQAALSDEEQFLKNAAKRREGIESILQNIPTRLRENIEQNKGIEDETEIFVP